MNSHEVFIHIHQGCFAGTGAIVRLPQCQWSKPDGYGKISQCITTTKHSKAKTVCIFLGIYCSNLGSRSRPRDMDSHWNLTVHLVTSHALVVIHLAVFYFNHNTPRIVSADKCSWGIIHIKNISTDISWLTQQLASGGTFCKVFRITLFFAVFRDKNLRCGPLVQPLPIPSNPLQFSVSR